MMNVNVQGLRRNVKNVVRNYTDAQVKVREATSNDPWGAPSTLMGEIADLTYNVVAFTEIMQIVWKRLNDNGKNWRHVYKALVLLEYLIKVGSERVASQCKENIFNIQTLKDFQYVEDNKDQGMNVREKSKQLVALLKDDERLRQERMRALKAKERFAQNTNVATAESGSEELASPRDYRAVLGSNSELESARPQTAGEEELQLQLALAMSKEEAEREERQRKNDDLRLQMALTESQQEAVKPRSSSSAATANGASSKSCMDDLLGLNLGGAGQAVAGAASADPWGLPSSQPAAAATAAAFPNVGVDAMPASLVGAVGGIDPWAPAPSVQADPWAPQPATSLPSAAPDPWALNGAAGGVSKGELDEFDLISRQRLNNMSPAMGGDKLGGSANHSPAPFDMSGMGGALPKTTGHNNSGGGINHLESNSKNRKTPESFLGANSNLVNLDALVTAKPATGSINPFGGNAVPATGSSSASSAISAAMVVPSGMPAGSGGMLSSAMTPPLQNPFQALNKPPTMNELRGGNAIGFEGGFASGPARTTPTPGSVNPFL